MSSEARPIGSFLTGGDYETEEIAWGHFDRAMAWAPEAFRVYREVPGEIIHPRPSCRGAGQVRIDRLLVPRGPAIAAGWFYGAIGVEGKKSGVKIGKAISQALDYTHAVWELPDCKVLVMCRWIFLWPTESAGGDFMSIMAQQRIGNVRLSGRRLVFSCGGTNGLTVSREGIVEAGVLPMGNKAGNRG